MIKRVYIYSLEELKEKYEKEIFELEQQIKELEREILCFKNVNQELHKDIVRKEDYICDLENKYEDLEETNEYNRNLANRYLDDYLRVKDNYNYLECDVSKLREDNKLLEEKWTSAMKELHNAREDESNCLEELSHTTQPCSLSKMKKRDDIGEGYYEDESGNILHDFLHDLVHRPKKEEQTNFDKKVKEIVEQLLEEKGLLKNNE